MKVKQIIKVLPNPITFTEFVNNWEYGVMFEHEKAIYRQVAVTPELFNVGAEDAEKIRAFLMLTGELKESDLHDK